MTGALWDSAGVLFIVCELWTALAAWRLRRRQYQLVERAEHEIKQLRP